MKSDVLKIGVRVMPREVILDTQGRAVEQTLHLEGHENIGVRVGKYIELELSGKEARDRAAALKRAEEIAKSILHNPLIETYTLEVDPR